MCEDCTALLTTGMTCGTQLRQALYQLYQLFVCINNYVSETPIALTHTLLTASKPTAPDFYNHGLPHPPPAAIEIKQNLKKLWVSSLALAAHGCG